MTHPKDLSALWREREAAYAAVRDGVLQKPRLHCDPRRARLRVTAKPIEKAS
jgi:hypothetical protein